MARPDRFEPYFDIMINGKSLVRTLGNRVTRLTYQEAEDKDDELEIELVSERGDIVDNELLAEGNTIAVRYGYKGRLSDTRTGVLLAPDPYFEGVVRITLRARDLGSLLHSTASQEVWTSVRHSDIARQIAARYGLQPEVTDTEKIIDAEPQGNLSDFLFLEKLAKQDGFVFYVEQGRLFYGPRKLAEAPALVLEYYTARQATGLIKRFGPRSKRHSKRGAARRTVAIGYDPFERKAIRHEATESSTSETRLARRYTVDADTGELSRQIDPLPHHTEEEVRSAAEATRRDAELDQLEADLIIIGTPEIHPKRIVRILGVGARYSGNWYVRTATHKIDGNGYETALELRRDGTDSDQPNTGETSRPVNSQEGSAAEGDVQHIIDADTGKEVPQ